LLSRILKLLRYNFVAIKKNDQKIKILKKKKDLKRYKHRIKLTLQTPLKDISQIKEKQEKECKPAIPQQNKEIQHDR
jgi:hypothetical protein